MTAGFSAKGSADPSCPQPQSGLTSNQNLAPNQICPKPRQPHPYHVDLSWGSLYGTSYPNQNTVDGNSQPDGYADLHGPIDASQGIATTELPHSVLQASAITLADGTEGYQLYVSTQSVYAPNGDSGTFVFSSSGELLSGTQADLERLRGEVEDADPASFTSLGVIPAGFWSNLGHQIEHGLGCAGASAMDLGAGMLLLDPATAPAAADVLFGGGGWGILATVTETECF